MRIATFSTSSGEPRAGVVVTQNDGTDAVVDIADASGGKLASDVLELLGGGAGVLDDIRSLSTSDAAAVALSDVVLLAPVPRPPKVIAAAMNYQAHIVDDVKRDPFDRDRIVPKLFLKPVTAVMGTEAPLRLPTVSHAVDWEVELACVIGTGGSDIPPADALTHVAGYTVINDVSARSMDWGLKERVASHWDDFFDWLGGKWLNGFAPTGPWLVTADEIDDPQAIQLELRLNGEVRQRGSTADMLFSVAELISFASRLMQLEPGDVIATGTPSGVGDATGTYLAPGDVMEAEVQGIGILRTPVIAPPAP